MDDKKFLTYDEQITFLKRDKKLIIKDEDAARSLLKKYSYFALVNGYKYPFKDKNGLYKAKTTIDDIYFLYCFDNRIRYLFIESIMEVETHIKSLLSYAFANKFGESENAYLAVTNYNYGNVVYQSGINQSIQILTDILDNYTSYPYMKHQKAQHRNIPPWVIMKALTLGNISKLYSYQQPSIQTVISKEFSGVSEGDLQAFLDVLTRFRNVCAHNERLFDYRYNKRSINNMKVHKDMDIPKKNNRYTKGKSDLFAVLIALKYLLEKDSFSKLVCNLSDAIDEFFRKTSQIQRDQLYKYMGFTADWRKIELLCV